jgi:hypothetical protein
MLDQVKQIIEGHAKLLHNSDVILQELAVSRLRNCKSCVLYNGLTCDSNRYAEHIETGKQTHGCGCHMKAKVLIYNVDCPLAKWTSKLTPKELLEKHSNWNKISDNEYSNRYSILTLTDTWYVDDSKGKKKINTYDEFISILNS